MVKTFHLNGAFSSHRGRLAFLVHSDKSGRDMAHLRLVYKRPPTRHELEQQLDALANDYGVSKDKKVFEKMLEVCRRIEVLKTQGD
jgi:hypothetical protein